MSARLITLFVVTLAFTALSVLALKDVGYLGILEPHFRSWGEGQVLMDLVILAVLACTWMVRDARVRGLSPWPFILVTVLAGSFGPLLYLLVRELRGAAGHRSVA